MHIVMVGPFGLAPKQTMRMRALPMGQALVRRGHRVSMLLPPWSNPKDAGSSQEQGGVTIRNLRLPPRVPLVFQLALGSSLARQALSYRPDVIHCFKPKAYAGLVAWTVWQLKRSGITRARLVVDSDDWEGAGGWNDVERYAWPLKRFFAWQERWGMRHVDALTVASRALQTIAWSLGARRNRVYYLPNGVTALPDPAMPPATTYGAHATLLLYTRFFEFELERIARLFARLGDQEPDLRFMVVGQGFFGEEKKFARLLKETSIWDRVTWLGMLPASGLPVAFAQASVAIYPFDDTLLNRTKCSVKLTDLLAAGVPVVAEAVGQNAEYIVHGESGLLVRSGDEAAFLTAVRDVLHDENLRARLGEGARRRMCEQFSWDRLIAQVESAYGL